jgi:hypothetical protein
MANPLYDNTYTKDITDNILLNTGLDYSEIAELLSTQISNCIKLVLRGQRIWIEQVTALANDKSNKDCFETTITYSFCGQNFTYKVKLDIKEPESCTLSYLYDITYTSPNFTINGQITTAVWLEYSINAGTTWVRLPNSFPIGTSITTNLLPTGVDLKVRVIAVCDETKISNEVSFVYIETFGFNNSGWSDVSIQDSCSDALINNRTIYSNCSTPIAGCQLFRNASGTMIVNKSFVYIDGFGNFDVNPSSGIIIQVSSVQC